MIGRARTFSTPHLLFCLTAKSVSFSSWLFEVRLSNLFCGPEHRNRPQLLAKDHRNGIIVDCWSNILAMQRFAPCKVFCDASRFSPSSHKMHSTQILIVCCEHTYLFVDLGSLLCSFIIPTAFPHQERWKTQSYTQSFIFPDEERQWGATDHWLKIQIYYTA